MHCQCLGSVPVRTPRNNLHQKSSFASQGEKVKHGRIYPCRAVQANRSQLFGAHIGSSDEDAAVANSGCPSPEKRFCSRIASQHRMQQAC